MLYPDRLGNSRRKARPSYAERREWGREAEERFFRICAESLRTDKLPEWVESVREATVEEDHQGIDAWLLTSDPFYIPINVKRSIQSGRASRRRQWNTRSLRDRRKDIVEVVASPHASDEAILGQIIRKIEKWRRTYGYIR